MVWLDYRLKDGLAQCTNLYMLTQSERKVSGTCTRTVLSCARRGSSIHKTCSPSPSKSALSAYCCTFVHYKSDPKLHPTSNRYTGTFLLPCIYLVCVCVWVTSINTLIKRTASSTAQCSRCRSTMKSPYLPVKKAGLPSSFTDSIKIRNNTF